MTGLDGRRVYLDWNATAPLRPEARAAMLEAMETVGNPSSIHAEGRAARAIVERARARVARLMGAAPSEVVFTSGATEAANAVLAQGWDDILVSPIEHDAIRESAAMRPAGRVMSRQQFEDFGLGAMREGARGLTAVQAANGETGASVLHHVFFDFARKAGYRTLCDATQCAGRRLFSFSAGPPVAGADYAILSAHKLGGPKGIGALLVRDGAPFGPCALGGGQETGRRAGTENVIGIAGFGAAAEAARRDHEDGVWERVENLRIILENTLAEAAPDRILFGQDAPRLPNTTCFAVPGWKGETQVMAMDLAGFAVSAGSACASGKVAESRVLRAMGYPAEVASSAIRVSMGPTTTEAEVRAFAKAWIDAYRRRTARVARETSPAGAE